MQMTVLKKKPSSVFCSQYKRGELVLKSNNLSSLAILREFITKEATLQKTRIQLSFKLDAGSISHSVNNLWPRIKQHMQHSRENLLLEALQVCIHGLHEMVACSARCKTAFHAACARSAKMSTRMQVPFCVQEIKMQEGECSFLAADLKKLLDTAGQDKDEQAKESVKLEYLLGLVKDMFLDWQRFSGTMTSKSRLRQLTELLHNNSSTCQQVIDFILNS